LSSHHFGSKEVVHAVDLHELGEPARALDDVRPVAAEPAPVQRMTVQHLIVGRPELDGDGVRELRQRQRLLGVVGRVDDPHVGAVPVGIRLLQVEGDERAQPRAQQMRQGGAAAPTGTELERHRVLLAARSGE
jgi:hypothetical protein